MTRPGAAVVMVAPESWKAIDLLSDVHLCADMPRTFEAWRARMLATDADAVLILGDLFEVWVGDDAAGGGFERECTEVLRQSARSRHLAFMCGNRDFLLSRALLAELGVTYLADPTLLLAWGQRLLLSHGDALCLDDLEYQRFRARVRGLDWQCEFLAKPLTERQALARRMRDASSAHQAERARGITGPVYTDIDIDEALAWLALNEAPTLIHGHTHRPGHGKLDADHSRHVLGDWDLDGVLPRASMLRLTRDGLADIQPPLAPTAQ